MPTFSTPEPISATIDVFAGDVQINAGESGDTVVEVRPSDPSNAKDVKSAELTTVEYEGGRLLVKSAKVRRTWLDKSAGSVDVTIELPSGSQAQGDGQATDFRSEGPLGDCRMKTGVGSIWLDQVGSLNAKSQIGDIGVGTATGQIEVTAGIGEVRLRELAGDGEVKNSMGDTWIGAADGDLRVKTAHGSIAVDKAEADVTAKTASGSVRLGEVARGTVVAETGLGDLEVGIREGTAAWLDVQAKGGKVRNLLDAATAPEATAEAVRVRGRISVGTIVIRRA